MRYRAIIFDLDGVLCFTDKYHYLAWKKIADEEGIYFDEEINSRLRGVSRMQSLDIILERAERSYSPSEKQKLADEKNKIYVGYLNGMTEECLNIGAKQTLSSLKEKGVSLAVGSSSKNTKLILRKLSLEGYFDAVSDGNNISKSKPDPEVFLKAAQMLKMQPEGCLVVEDASSGIAAANAGGFASAAIGAAYGNKNATYSIKELKELINL